MLTRVDSMIEWLSNTKAPITHLGQKGERLARIALAGMRVPEGFVLDAQALLYESRLERSGRPYLRPKVISAVSQAYRILAAQQPQVAVRSSGIDEDGVGASYAGQFRTNLNVEGELAVLTSVGECWESLHGSAQSYSAVLGTPRPTTIAIVVQHMVFAEYSGVCFTRNPVTAEAVYEIEYCRGTAERPRRGCDNSRPADDKTWRRHRRIIGRLGGWTKRGNLAATRGLCVALRGDFRRSTGHRVGIIGSSTLHVTVATNHGTTHR